MRPPALEIIGITGAKDTPLAIDGHLDAAGNDDAAFLAVVHQRYAPGVAAGTILLAQDLQRAAEQIVADLHVGDRLLADLGQLVGTIERLARPLRLDGEELRQPHRDAVEN